jgi:hypothetical protein
MLTDEDKQWIVERLGNLEQRFEQRLETVEQRFAERLEKVETTLLTEFHKWASPLEMRQRSHAAAIKALDVEVAISDRLRNLEGR